MVNRYSIFMWSLLFIWFNIINIWKIKSNKVLLFIFIKMRKWLSSAFKNQERHKSAAFSFSAWLSTSLLLYKPGMLRRQKETIHCGRGCNLNHLNSCCIITSWSWMKCNNTMVKWSFKLLSPPTTLTDYDL